MAKRMTLQWAFEKPILMGIVNLTPDSFSDGGMLRDTDTTLRRIDTLISEGADWIDVGAESSRPGALPISAEAEIQRLSGLLKAYRKRFDTPLSVDTTKAIVAAFALDHGAEIINDISALEDPDMAATVAAQNAALIVMHRQGTPQVMQQNPQYEDVVAEVIGFLAERALRAKNAGISQVLIDPGIGFGKSVHHNVRLLTETGKLAQLGYPVVIGTSRKSMIHALTGADVSQRLPGSVASAVMAYARGASVFRVHDVAAHRQALAVAQAIREVGPDA
jgi:dihydropteroate synthase